ncbi:hypothetical protein I3842_03G062300 [Carya illinoinensis]|uniref:Uncharacterized protein n=1 Tax=Carya illinoinensis TaxID=32201 RepID=A0A922FEC0_CARIL|nr:hypothetical protein I3842_03G062300 [Carya illinoinensis]
MEATKLLSFPTLHCRPFPSTSPRHRRRVNLRSIVAAASRGDHWGRLVDENMIALRLRIREMKISETNYEPPLNWMEWEKQYFLRCNEDISEALVLLQNYLMNTRPGLAFGMVALVFFSVLISYGVAFIHAMEIAKRILSIWV